MLNKNSDDIVVDQPSIFNNGMNPEVSQEQDRQWWTNTGFPSTSEYPKTLQSVHLNNSNQLNISLSLRDGSI